jgi:hypothetical protein
VVAVGAGARLEQAAEPGARPVSLFADLLAQVIGQRADSHDHTPQGRVVVT